MVKMLCGIGGIEALGDWVQLKLKPEKIVSDDTDIQGAISDLMSGKKTGFFDNLTKQAQEETRQQLFPDKIRIPVHDYMRDDWNISTRVIVDIQIVQTWKPKKDAPTGHVFDLDKREVE